MSRKRAGKERERSGEVEGRGRKGKKQPLRGCFLRGGGAFLGWKMEVFLEGGIEIAAFFIILQCDWFLILLDI